MEREVILDAIRKEHSHRSIGDRPILVIASDQYPSPGGSVVVAHPAYLCILDITVPCSRILSTAFALNVPARVSIPWIPLIQILDSSEIGGLDNKIVVCIRHGAGVTHRNPVPGLA